MTIDTVKEQLTNHIGDSATIKCNLGRNKYEKYDVIIKELYAHIFLVEMKEKNLIKSFSYSDVISKNVRIDY
jgi:uncharacterized protein Veg